jgi:hypothetical protein
MTGFLSGVLQFRDAVDVFVGANPNLLDLFYAVIGLLVVSAIATWETEWIGLHYLSFDSTIRRQMLTRFAFGLAAYALLVNVYLAQARYFENGESDTASYIGTIDFDHVYKAPYSNDTIAGTYRDPNPWLAAGWRFKTLNPEDTNEFEHDHLVFLTGLDCALHVNSSLTKWQQRCVDFNATEGKHVFPYWLVVVATAWLTMFARRWTEVLFGTGRRVAVTLTFSACLVLVAWLFPWAGVYTTYAALVLLVIGSFVSRSMLSEIGHALLGSLMHYGAMRMGAPHLSPLHNDPGEAPKHLPKTEVDPFR